MIVSVEELKNNEELNFLFKEQLEEVIASFLSEPQEDITALYKVLDMYFCPKIK
jgi:hypothetical protein